jgi:hypothetical protein
MLEIAHSVRKWFFSFGNRSETCSDGADQLLVRSPHAPYLRYVDPWPDTLAVCLVPFRAHVQTLSPMIGKPRFAVQRNVNLRAIARKELQ